LVVYARCFDSNNTQVVYTKTVSVTTATYLLTNEAAFNTSMATLPTNLTIPQIILTAGNLTTFANKYTNATATLGFTKVVNAISKLNVNNITTAQVDELS
jgi:hypothetical protein